MFSNLLGVKITHICGCYPKNPKSIDVLSNGNISKKEAERIAKGTGFKQLRIGEKRLMPSDYAVEAAEKIFTEGGVDRKSVDGLVFVTQYPDYLSPGTSHVMQDRLQLRNDIVAYDITQACSGYIYGLHLASMLVASKSCKKVLLCVGAICGTENANSENRATIAVFGDGGAATIVEAADVTNSIAFGFKTYGERYQLLLQKRSGYRFPRVSSYDPNVTQEMLKENNTFMDGMAIMKFSLSDVPQDIKVFLRELGCVPDDVDLFAVHQANGTIVNYLADALGVDRKKVPFTACDIGNTASATIPIFLSRDAKQTSLNLKKVCMSGFGAGLSVGIAYTDLSSAVLHSPVEV